MPDSCYTVELLIHNSRKNQPHQTAVKPYQEYKAKIVSLSIVMAEYSMTWGPEDIALAVGYIVIAIMLTALLMYYCISKKRKAAAAAR